MSAEHTFVAVPLSPDGVSRHDVDPDTYVETFPEDDVAYQDAYAEDDNSSRYRVDSREVVDAYQASSAETLAISNNHYHEENASEEDVHLADEWLHGDGPVGGQTRCEQYSRIATRLILSPRYSLFYILIVMLTLFLVIWGAVHHSFFTDLKKEDDWYIALDVLTTMLFCGEVAVRIIAQQKTFFRSCLNRVDFFVLVVCTLGLMLYFVDPETSILGSAVLMVRYLVQLMRLVIVWKHTRDRQRVVDAVVAGVDFSGIPDESPTARLVHGSTDVT